MFWLMLYLVGSLFPGCKPSHSADIEQEESLTTNQEEKIAMHDTVSKKYLLGKFDPATDSNFVRCVSPYAGGSALNQYLRKETFEAFRNMYEAAKVEGIQLTILSATRNFTTQKSIWEAKWTGGRKVGGQNLSIHLPDPTRRAREILKYSSMPGSSRHHWGTDIDLNAFNNAYFEQGKGKAEYDWLKKNASRFGFCQPYTEKYRGGRTGYNEERWHWSYTPLSKGFLAAYVKQVSLADIAGFKGAETALASGIIEAYVKGVGEACK